MWLLPDHNYVGKAVIQNSYNQSESTEMWCLLPVMVQYYFVSISLKESQ